MYVHYHKLLQYHYYIITLSYCHGTAYYYLITTKRLFRALALVTAAVPGTGQSLTGRISSRYKHRTGISNPCGHLCQWTWTTVTGLLVTRADSAAEKWPWQALAAVPVLLQWPEVLSGQCPEGWPRLETSKTEFRVSRTGKGQLFKFYSTGCSGTLALWLRSTIY